MTPAALFAIAIAGVIAASGAAAQDDGLWSQAIEYYDDEEFARERGEAMHEQGGRTEYFFIGERLEYQSREGSPLLLFEGEGWFGGDRNKLWIKSDVEYDFDDEGFAEAELQALWSRPIARYFDIQAGLRRDFEPDPSRTFGVFGIKGLAPYWFEIDAALFVSGHGEVSARLEGEYDLLLTQRLILQPRAELNFAAQSVDEQAIGTGLSTAELGGRIRYEIKRQFAPYIGVSWTRAVGDTADIARAAGDNIAALSFVGGVRFWF